MTLLRKLTRVVVLLSCVPLAGIAPAHAQENSEPPKLTMTTIDVPGAAVTEVNGINSTGEMVGTYGQSTLGALSGFLYSSGAFTYFNYPGQSVTVPGGINDSDLIVGLATQEAGERSTVVGFLYDGAAFTTLQDGDNAVTNAYGINNAGTVVGSAGQSVYAWRGFEEKNGKYGSVNLPGQCDYKYASGINNFGETVGFTFCGLDEYGYAVTNGKPRNIEYPGTTQTTAMGVNDHGVIVGSYGSGASTYGFAYLNGKYISFSYPGVQYTYAAGISKSGQIVGSYTSDFNVWHGFITTPVTPADFERPGCCQAALVEGR